MTTLAYLDPGSGSIILQALLGGIAGAAIAGRLWMSRVRTLVRRRRPGDDALQPEAPSPAGERSS